MLIYITKLYMLISVWMTFVFIQGHSYRRNQKLPTFTQNCQWSWMQFSVLPQLVHFYHSIEIASFT